MKARASRAVWWLAAYALVGVGCDGTAQQTAAQAFGPDPVAPHEAAEYRAVCERYAKRPAAVERTEAENEILVNPRAEQLVAWRALAYCAADSELQSEALRQLAWLGDPAGVAIAGSVLRRDSHALRRAAALALAHYGSPTADSAKAALRVALQAADESDERQLVWALVVLQERAIFSKAIELWRADKLTSVQRLDGNPAFDLRRVAALVPEKELAAFVSDPEPALRSLGATWLAEHPQLSSQEQLRKLLEDPETSVAAPAASGLARLATAEANQALVAELRKADGERRRALLQALSDGAGGPGLVLALDAVASEPEERRWFQYQQTFRLMGELADPRIADPLSHWLGRNAAHLPLHWQTEAALRLAEVGDVRGVEVLGRRMGAESAELYDRAKPWQTDAGGHLTRGDGQRGAAARRLGELAVMKPDQSQHLGAVAGGPVLEWLQSRVLPQADGLRFLAAVRYEPARRPMHDWAFPSVPLPAPGDPPPLGRPFEIVPSALRAVGWMRSPEALPLLLSQFDRKQRSLDLRLQTAAGRAPLGQALCNVGRGAADGLSQWGADAGEPAVSRLVRVAEDDSWPEDVRLAACGALAHVAAAADVERWIDRLDQASGHDELYATCYAEALGQRAGPEHTAALIHSLRGNLPEPARLSLGWAIGGSGWADAATAPQLEQQLVALLDDPDRRLAAALALMLGGSPDGATRAAAATRRISASEQQVLRTAYERAVAIVYQRDVLNVARWVVNAEAMARISALGTPEPWEVSVLTTKLRGLELDAGPHTLTLPVLRYRLLSSARAGSEPAVRALHFMGERGSLMALAAEGGAVGRLAERALGDSTGDRRRTPP
jgi:hypothetical protein